MDDDTKPYWVNQEAEAYQVLNANNTLILETRDDHSAQHYAALLNQAYQAGYKKGYRAGKK